MHKKVLPLIFTCVGLIVLALLLFWFNSSDPAADKCAKISTTIVSSLLSGLVSFTGLFITIRFQLSQAEEKKAEEIRPCFVIRPKKTASAEKPISLIQQSPDNVICYTSQQVRTEECILQNVKNSFAINTSICDNLDKTKHFIGSVEREEKTINLVLCAEESYLMVRFEDVYGNKYLQRINYSYSSKLNQYTFELNQPQKE